MSSNIYRGPLTALLLTTLRTELSSIGAGIPIGDGVVPSGAGWSGDPNAPTSHFQPYCVVVAGPANYSMGAFADSQSDWHFPYMVGNYNATREGLDFVADRARGALDVLRNQTLNLGTDTYEVQFVRIEAIGGTNRVDATDPPFWGQTDSISVWVSKEI